MSTEKITFPDGFLWGVASSSYQTEGGWNEDGRGESIWDRFCHTPGNIKNGDTADVACDHYHLHKKDVALMKKLGVQAYRFSTSWSRVLPKGKGDINRVGLEFYNRLVDELLEAGIEPWICLYHYDLPQALQDEGGWASRSVIRSFADYAGLMAREFGDRVKRWLIFNEPRCVAWFGHLTGMHAPGIKNLKLALEVSHHLLLAQGKAIQTLREVDQDLRIGTIVDLNAIHPISDDEKDQKAAGNLDEFWNRWFLDPVFNGKYPPLAKVAGFEPKREDMDLIKQPLDFLGVNYYTRLLGAYDSSNPFMQAKEIKKKAPVTERGWEIYPNGLYEVLTRLRREYQDPVLYVTENGAAFEDNVKRNGAVQDDDRIAFLRDHIIAAYRAIRERVRLNGYFVWTIMDNFEWAEGYSKRFGLAHTDFRTLKRTPKKSFHWYRQVIQNNGFVFT